MTEKFVLKKGDYGLLLILLIVLFSSITAVASGIVYIELVPEYMAFILSILVPIATMMAGIVFTYSLAQFILEKRFRNLILVFFAVNMIITTILYFTTNLALVSISPFADRERNRTIVTSFTFILAPSLLFAGVSEEIDYTQKRMIFATLWGVLVIPVLMVWFMLSPEAVFITSIPGEGITPIAYSILICIIFLFGNALRKYYFAWKAEQKRLDLAALFSLLIWLISVVLFSFQNNPLLFMEIVWFSIYIVGVLVLAIAVITAEVIEPRKTLSELVNIRTSELKESKREIEYYLNIWGHKIGNILQGMTLYMEMISTGTKDNDELKTFADTGLEIGAEAYQINQQVAALIKVKEQDEYLLSSIDIGDAIDITRKSMQDKHGSKWRMTSQDINQELFVYADEFLTTIFDALFSFIWKHSPDSDLQITLEDEKENIILNLQFAGQPISKDIIESLFAELQPTKTTLSLDLFTAKILMKRYKGFFNYKWFENNKENQFELVFRKASQSHYSSHDKIKLIMGE
ncbi:hypothetical protein EU528_11270 [Candidatus Thorarchaeota archaeon]|nr:MAG: hypothetical protein EU528_11270 [Candidatus Thorarchaeota archaeon]